MRNNLKKGIAIALALAIIVGLGVALAGEGSRGILYRVQNGVSTVYLLGSIHVGNEEMYPLGEAIQQAMEASDTFVFECDTFSNEALGAVLELMYYTDGTKLEDVISPEVYRKLEAACKKTGYPARLFGTMRPWVAMSQFSMQVTAAEMGVDDVTEANRLGVESVVQDFVRENGRPMDYLESTQKQLEVFDNMSMPLQEYLLDEALTVVLDPEAVQGMDTTIRDWPRWWRDGNISAFVDSYQIHYLSEILGEPEATLLKEYHDTLVSRRNQTMADTVEGYLQGQTPHTWFVTVGLLHVVLPEDSIVQRLQDRGYAVECLSVP